MMTDTEIRMNGIRILNDQLGDIETERFIILMQKEPFDYTKWRQNLDEQLSLEEISARALALKTSPA